VSNCYPGGQEKGADDGRRLALCILPETRWSAHEIQTVAREAEEAGFDAIFTNEGGNDALATAQLMGAATQRILVGTYIINIYLRHPYVCAQGAALIADATGGRFVLGLGVSHQPVNEALGSTCIIRRRRCGTTSPPCRAGSGARAR